MKSAFNKHVVYYTIINKNKLNLQLNNKCKDRLETSQSLYVLDLMLKHFGIEKDIIFKTKLGKPYFKGKRIYYNYSHSKNFIACAISKYDVGIDIEEYDRIISKTMIKICNLTEDNKLEELVKREAFSKLTGKGVAILFNKNNFENINKKNIIINSSEYVCSIFSDCPEPSFQDINIK